MSTEYQTQVANTADQRTLGYFQLSVATSLAIESAVGIHPDLPRPDTMPIRRYKGLWINLRTLFRNIMGAMSPEVASGISAPEIAQILSEEMEIIPDMLQEYAGYPVPVTYYFNNMNRLNKKYPEAELRKDTTPKQLLYAAALENVMRIMMADRRDRFKLTDDQLTGEAVKTLIITHVAYDLLSEKNFGSLDLLESHTGRIKPKSLWYSKYYQGRDLAHIPFTAEMLQVFGDLDTFHPLDKKLRESLLEIAEKRQWSFTTSRDRIVGCIGDLKNPAHILKMKKIYNVLI